MLSRFVQKQKEKAKKKESIKRRKENISLIDEWLDESRNELDRMNDDAIMFE